MREVLARDAGWRLTIRPVAGRGRVAQVRRPDRRCPIPRRPPRRCRRHRPPRHPATRMSGRRPRQSALPSSGPDAGPPSPEPSAAPWSESPARPPPRSARPRPRQQDRRTKPVDWRQWLDIVDEVGLVPAGVQDPELAEGLLRRYGIAKRSQLDGRAEARAAFHELQAMAPDGVTPAVVRRLMDDWEFRDARSTIRLARPHRVAARHPATRQPGPRGALGALRAGDIQAGAGAAGACDRVGDVVSRPGPPRGQPVGSSPSANAGPIVVRESSCGEPQTAVRARQEVAERYGSAPWRGRSSAQVHTAAW